jgi:hypothetical protein
MIGEEMAGNGEVLVGNSEVASEKSAKKRRTSGSELVICAALRVFLPSPQ